MSARAASPRLMQKVLEQIQQPGKLDSHPWTNSRAVRNMGADSPLVASAGPGERLVLALRILFLQMMPESPPHPGKLLDPRWGEFGVLAARYFAPLEFGVPVPISLRQAWSRIDASILLFVRAGSDQPLSQDDLAGYQLVGGEPDSAHVRRLNEWHKKGIEKLTAIFQSYENHLRRMADIPANAREGSGKNANTRKLSGGKTGWRRHPAALIFTGLAMVGLLMAGYKAWSIYRAWTAVQADVSQLQAEISAPLDSLDLTEVENHLVQLQRDVGQLREESGPLLEMGRGMGWLPYYGGDLASAEDLLSLSGQLAQTAAWTVQTLQPLQVEINTPQAGPASRLSRIVDQLQNSRPQLMAARMSLEEARQVRTRINAQRLSPGLQRLLSSGVDPALAKLDDVITASMALPDLLGATDGTSRTYLLLVENEDELRPTGGFITSVGTLEVMNGRILGLTFEDSGNLEDWTKPYPLAPWQLNQYMNSPVLVLRDSNWFVNYPTAVKYARLLYQIGQAKPVRIDGVIAFNQQALIAMLKVLGPIQVEGIDYPITASNVVDYMRNAKTPPPAAEQPSDWYRKAFIPKIAQTILERLLSPGDTDWANLSLVMLNLLDERQILIQVNNVDAAQVIARNGWDGSIRPDGGDFVYVVDSNIGFNKTNAVVSEQLTYDVDLSEPARPTSLLSVIQSNHASPDVPCIQWGEGIITSELWYPIDRCYWDYLRVYQTSRASLVEATPHSIPADWTILGQAVQPQVDDLDDGIFGVQGYGTLVVIPGGQSLATSFKFALPAGILAKEPDSDQAIYRLKIQKQPGTQATPVTVRIHLPQNAEMVSIPPGAFVQENNVMVRAELNTDLDLEVVVRLH